MAFGEKKPSQLSGEFGKPDVVVAISPESDSGSLAGSALIKAIKSGDGAGVFEAFKAMASAMDDGGDEEMDEPIAAE